MCKGKYLFNTFDIRLRLIMHSVYLGIGTNLGNREENLKRAIAEIEEKIGIAEQSSSIYQTEPWGFNSKEQFLNMVVVVKTKLNPSELLVQVHNIEADLGRTRREERYVSRIIDVDILLYDDLIVLEENLKIPHPLMQERKFVLVPLCEINSEMIHPVLRKTMGDLLTECKDKSGIYKF